MADEEVIEEGAEDVVEKEGKKYITATLNVETDADLIRSYNLVRKVGDFANGELLTLGIAAAKETDKWKKAVAEIKDAV